MSISMRLHASRKIVADRWRAARFVFVAGRMVHPIDFALAQRLHSCFAGKEQEDEDDKNNRKNVDVEPHDLVPAFGRRGRAVPGAMIPAARTLKSIGWDPSALCVWPISCQPWARCDEL